MYQNDQRNKVNILGDFEIETPTHISATYAISKIRLKFQNRIPRDLDQKLDILRIRMIHWIRFNFLNSKNRYQKKVVSIFNPGIQPSNAFSIQ